MKIGFKSDIHLDFWVGSEASKSDIEKFVLEVLKPKKADVLILAGDIGHYNFQNAYLIEILSRYSKVFVTYGNHDLYLIEAERERFKFSFNRLDDFKKRVAEIEGAYFFDGDLVEFGGIKFLGIAGWYDFSLGLKYGYSLEFMKKAWEEVMNDSRLIIPKIDPVNLSFLHKEKLRQYIEKADIIFTHIPPVYVSCKSDIIIDSFYSFYGYDLLKDNIKYWIFGHCHTPMDFYEEMIRFISSPLGYPERRRGTMEIDYLNLKGV
ncbi:metallophosphoesterase family protein [Caminibacter sp.]